MKNNAAPDPWKRLSVLITGVSGTVGAELLRQLASRGCERVVGIDNNETELFFLSQAYSANPAVKLFLGDIRDRDKIQRLMGGIDVVLHAAAFKHVILCEESPWDAVQTNVNGLINIIDAAQVNRVKRVLFTFSDKAVSPTFRPGDIEIKTTGVKAGEKMYEELTSEEENRRTIELDRFFAVLPAFKSIYHDIDYTYDGVLRSMLDRPYVSKTPSRQ